MTLGAQVVDLSRLHLRDDIHQVGAVTEITVVSDELGRTCIFSLWVRTRNVEDQARYDVRSC